MSLHRLTCPECGAGLKSASGFIPGKTVRCPKCQSYFVVDKSLGPPPRESEAQQPPPSRKPAGVRDQPAAAKKPVKAVVADEDDDDKPQKKKKKKSADAEWSYKNSPLRYAVLGVLLVIMGVLGFMLYQKRMREADETASTSTPSPAEPAGFTPQPGGFPQAPIGLPQPGGPGRPDSKSASPKGPSPKNATPKGPPPKTKGPLPKGGPPIGPGTPGGPGTGGSPLDLLFGAPTTPPPPAEVQAHIMQKLKAELVGTWKADLGDGVTAEITYLANGTFTDTLTNRGTPQTITGTWQANELTAGNRGLKIVRTVSGVRSQVTAVFEDGELLHPTQESGVSGAFRKSASR